mmetsp:Transcript_52499/g.139313  ORF Transcript_52499/g.139313 Transcript_52499/m.139313 type:complete len:268 (-) Transcript_52499:1351-2154(-)
MGRRVTLQGAANGPPRDPARRAVPGAQSRLPPVAPLCFPPHHRLSPGAAAGATRRAPVSARGQGRAAVGKVRATAHQPRASGPRPAPRAVPLSLSLSLVSLALALRSRPLPVHRGSYGHSSAPSLRRGGSGPRPEPRGGPLIVGRATAAGRSWARGGPRGQHAMPSPSASHREAAPTGVARRARKAAHMLASCPPRACSRMLRWWGYWARSRRITAPGNCSRSHRVAATHSLALVGTICPTVRTPRSVDTLPFRRRYTLSSWLDAND